jgi:uncharacterized caspase-like protein
MKRLVFQIAVLCWFLLVSFAPGAQAERRVALVIGNSAYQSASRLDNPVNDATAVAELLKQARFDVVTARTDLGVLDFKRAIREFINTTRNSDIAVVYYAGHGIEIGGINYLVPVDAKLASDLDAEDEAVELDRIIRALEPARRLRLVILDACRDNPFSRKMERTIAMRAVSAGLAKVEPAMSDTLIAYAARAGSTAEDGTNRHSPFTSALLNNLGEPGLDVRIAFGRIRDEVLKKTGNRQEPFVYGSLGGTTISLVPAPEVKAGPSTAEIRSDYELAERVGTVAAWESFLAVHGSGFYAELARAQRAKLLAASPTKPPTDKDMAVAALEPPSAKPPGPPERATADRLAWEKIENASDPKAFRDFLRRYPASPLAAAAQHRLDLLEQAAAERRREEEERQKAQEAERQRQEDERRARISEAERQKVESEAARRREEEERRAKAAEAARQKAEREAALKREAAEAAERRRQEDVCKRAEDRLARLRAAGVRTLGELTQFAQELTCDRVRPQVVALLEQFTAEAAKQPPPEENTPALIRSAQSELVRIGCYAGGETGSLDAPTKQAMEAYLSKRGQPTADIKITEAVVSELKQQPVIQGCVAALAPKPEPVAREREKKPKPTVQRARERPAQAGKREAAPREPGPARTEAVARPTGRPTGIMTGVGF